MQTTKCGKAKIVMVVALVFLLGAAFVLMSQEQAAQSAAVQVSQTLGDIIEAGESLTPEEVHETIGREPDSTRIPGKHRFVEEYRWQGPMSSHTVYAYYTTAATKLLEAVAMNQTLSDWEQAAR